MFLETEDIQFIIISVYDRKFFIMDQKSVRVKYLQTTVSTGLGS